MKITNMSYYKYLYRRNVKTILNKVLAKKSVEN